jgi:hypothetical protein
MNENTPLEHTSAVTDGYRLMLFQLSPEASVLTMDGQAKLSETILHELDDPTAEVETFTDEYGGYTYLAMTHYSPNGLAALDYDTTVLWNIFDQLRMFKLSILAARTKLRSEIGDIDLLDAWPFLYDASSTMYQLLRNRERFLESQ